MLANEDKDFTRELEFIVVPKITEITPLMSINGEITDILTNISLADYKFNVSGKIDLLLGEECYF